MNFYLINLKYNPNILIIAKKGKFVKISNIIHFGNSFSAQSCICHLCCLCAMEIDPFAFEVCTGF